MKPANFPGRKNDRRKVALARMSKDNPAYVATAKAIVEDSYARSIRSKKDHTFMAKLRKDK